MPKVDFTILKQKKFGLPVWAWALILALGLYLVYRHSKNNPSAAASPAPDTSGSSSSAGDLMSSGTTNAGNQDAGVVAGPSESFPDAGITSDFQDFMGQLEQGALAAHSNDTAQNQDTTTNDGTDSNAGTLGLTHISGAFWWDPDTHKLIKIPGSGGVKKGTGKKKVPNTTKAGGKKHKVKQKVHAAKKLVIHRPNITKKKTIPKPAPHQRPLTASQRRAIDARHHPAPKPPPKKKTAVHKAIRPPVRKPPKRQAVKKRGRG